MTDETEKDIKEPEQEGSMKYILRSGLGFIGGIFAVLGGNY